MPAAVIAAAAAAASTTVGKPAPTVAASGRQPAQPQRGLDDDPEGALGADQQAR